MIGLLIRISGLASRPDKPRFGRRWARRHCAPAKRATFCLTLITHVIGYGWPHNATATAYYYGFIIRFGASRSLEEARFADEGFDELSPAGGEICRPRAIEMSISRQMHYTMALSDLIGREHS
jgi:hypothetical protein